MNADEQQTPAVSDEPRCARCGEVIGVYEPMVRLLSDGTSIDASLAARPLTDDDASTVLRAHRACALPADWLQAANGAGASRVAVETERDASTAA